MTNEEEQITLNIDLYDNIMTEKEGDYTGRPRITGTLYNKQIAARIVKAGTEYKQESIEYILDRADKAKVEAIAEGKSVIAASGNTSSPHAARLSVKTRSSILSNIP